MNDSATSAIAIMPIANVSGAAGPAACTSSVMLNAAVTVGEMTASDKPTASGKLKREINFTGYPSPCRPPVAPLVPGQTGDLSQQLRSGALTTIAAIVAQRPVVALR